MDDLWGPLVLVCQGCGEVWDMGDEELQEILDQATTESDSVVLFCAKCVEKYRSFRKKHEKRFAMAENAWLN